MPARGRQTGQRCRLDAGDGRLRKILCAHHFVCLGIQRVVFFQAVKFFASGGGPGRIGRRLEFRLFCHGLLGVAGQLIASAWTFSLWRWWYPFPRRPRRSPAGCDWLWRVGRGVNVMEAFDIGAIFQFVCGGFCFVQSAHG